MSKAQATSFVQTYYANEYVRFNQSELDAYDRMLLQRSQKIIGWKRTKNLLGTDKEEVEAQERRKQLQCNMDSLEQKVSTLQEMQEQMQKQIQENHIKILAALQPLMRTTLPAQGSTSAHQTISAEYVRTGQPDAVYALPALQPNRYEITHGQGSRNQEPNPPPRHFGAHYMPPSQTRAEARETSYSPYARTGAGPAFVSGDDRQGVESVSVLSAADLVFWR